jgi:hypothetical protein
MLLNKKRARKSESIEVVMVMEPSLKMLEVVLLTTRRIKGKKVLQRSSIIGCERLFADFYN